MARGALRVASVGYGAAVSVRNLAFDRGWKARHTAGVPVVSVGNITLGGTGKTPMVEFVSRFYRERGLRVAILSRGYGQTGGMNDEGLVLEDNLPDVPHYQGPDRVALARTAVEESESQLLVLDDGFQHRRLARDLDLVLLDALDPFGLEALCPRGLLREPPQSLRRADVVILSRADLIKPTERAAIRMRAQKAGSSLRWAEARHAPRDLLDAEGFSRPLSELAGARVAAFCGLGNPAGFHRTLEQVGVKLIGFRAFPDHHPYSRDDVFELSSWAQEQAADFVLTTQKDFVKLRTRTLGSVPLNALRIGIEILSGEAELNDLLGALLPVGQ